MQRTIEIVGIIPKLETDRNEKFRRYLLHQFPLAATLSHYIPQINHRRGYNWQWEWSEDALAQEDIREFVYWSEISSEHKEVYGYCKDQWWEGDAARSTGY